MGKLFRLYNQNRRAIWSSIIFITFFVLLLQLIVTLYRRKNELALQEYAENTEYSTYTNSEQNNINDTTEHVITDNNTLTYIQKAENVINQFVEYCNNNDVASAYNMLTQDCKQVLFPTQSDFEQNYVKKIFTQNKTVKVEETMYGSSVLKVSYYNNVLENGGYNQQNTFQDYVYFVSESDETKISLNNFLYTLELDKTSEASDITIKVNKSNIYTDYEQYQIKITNGSDKTIQISQDESEICLIDNYNLEYTANISDMSIEPNESITLYVIFYKTYNNENESKKITIKNIVLNYNEYINGSEKENTEISIFL